MENLDQELAKAAQALEKLAKASPAPVEKSEGEEMTNKEFESVLDTLKTLGADSLRKSLPKLTEPQLRMVYSVLAKATSMDKEAVKQPPVVNIHEDKKFDGPKKADEEDEKLVKEENKDIKHQGDDSELEGQVIKSLSDDQLVKIISRMQERKLSKSECMGALEQYGQPKEKMEKMWDATSSEAPKAEAKPEEKKSEAPDAKANAAADKDIKEGLKQDDGFKDEKKLDGKKEEPKPEAEAKPEMEAKPEVAAKPAIADMPKPEEKKDEPKPPFQKSVKWKEPIHPATEALIKRGRNCHYNVDGAIAQAEERMNEMKKSKWASDPYEGEVMKKSEPTKKVTANDLIEQGLDHGPGELELKKAKRDWKPAGAFTVQSFSEGDIKFGPSVDLKKALPKGEGTRGGHIIGHTTTGKAIYADPKHPDHQHFTDEDHYDAHLANTMHQQAHENVLNGPMKRNNAGQHVKSASLAQHHGKSSKHHMDRIKAKDLSKLHPERLKTMGDVMGHAKKVATSQFATKEANQVSTKEAPEQKE